jgi:mRNA-degrading endonuclease RelE of RelBE toxin-antitoxin system
MVFVETPTFTRRVLQLLDDEGYGRLQAHLAKHPDAGDIIRSSGGLRKIRWAAKGHGKRGGVRVIYY